MCYKLILDKLFDATYLIDIARLILLIKHAENLSGSKILNNLQLIDDYIIMTKYLIQMFLLRLVKEIKTCLTSFIFFITN
jgi:hypothetical protein